MYGNECTECEENFVHHLFVREIYPEYRENAFNSVKKQKPNLKVAKRP